MPPEVPGLVTVTCTVPVVVMAELGIMVVSSDPLVNVVVSAVLLKLMTAFELKLEPSTSSANADVPWMTLGGVSCMMIGVVPGCCGIVERDPYPHPTPTAHSNKIVSSFIGFSVRRI